MAADGSLAQGCWYVRQPPWAGRGGPSILAAWGPRAGQLEVTCDPRYGSDAQIEVELWDVDGRQVLSARGPMNDSGGFSMTLQLPQRLSPGMANVVAYPADVDWCDDTGMNNRRHNPDFGEGPRSIGPVPVQRVSCVLPSVPLLVAAEPG